jgi:molybdopterin/thiamine biosynthesis adenylyltransferase
VPYERPRIKEIYGVLVMDKRVRLGVVEGYAAEIDDPDGRYTQLLTRLDGSRTPAELVAELAGVLDATEIDESLTLLDQGGYLEDAAAGVPPELSAAEAQRYRVNINFFNTLCGPGQSKYDLQLRLKNLRVGLIGLGGIGSNVAMALAELGVGTVRAIDFDRIELSNLNRQVLYSTDAVGELKADVAVRRIREFNPDIDFDAIAGRITCREDVSRFITGAAPDVVFCLADKPNGHIDHWINQACVMAGVPMVAGSIFGAMGNAYTVVPGRTACYNCRVLGELDGAPKLAEELDLVQRTNFSAVTAATGPSCMFHAYYLVYEMLRVTSGLGEPLTSDRLFQVNFLTFEQRYTDLPRRVDCDVCGGLPAPVGEVAATGTTATGTTATPIVTG